MRKLMRERKHGFTIIELLIVIAIIAILAAVAIPALLRAQKSGKESAALQVLRSLRTAEEAYKQKSTPMPRHYTNLTGLKADNSCTMAEGGLEPVSGYTFTSAAGVDQYTIVAIPPKTDMTTYSLIETGDITP